MSRLQDLARRVRRSPKQASDEDMAAWAASLPPGHPFMQPSPAVAAAAAAFEAAGGIPAWGGEPPAPADAAPLPAPVAAPETDAAVRQMAEDYFRPQQPGFTSARPPAETGPIHISSGRHVAPANARPAPHRPPMGRARLAEVRDILRDLPDRAPAGADGPRQELEAELHRQAQAEAFLVLNTGWKAETARQRVTRFTADARKRGGLPAFRAAGLARYRAVGCAWAGLDSLTPAGEWVPWPAGQWAQAMAAIGAQAEAARAEIGHHHAGQRQQEARIRAAADAAPALGYPREAL